MTRLEWIVAGLAGLIVGGLMMTIAWRHNPQCAFHCLEHGIQLRSLVAVGLAWAVPMFLLTATLLTAVHALSRPRRPDERSAATNNSSSPPGNRRTR